MTTLRQLLFIVSFASLMGCTDVVPEVTRLKALPSVLPPAVPGNEVIFLPGINKPAVTDNALSNIFVNTDYKMFVSVSKEDKNVITSSSGDYTLIPNTLGN